MFGIQGIRVSCSGTCAFWVCVAKYTVSVQPLGIPETRATVEGEGAINLTTLEVEGLGLSVWGLGFRV